MRSNEIAKLAGTTVRTLRHYHAIGLLPEPPRQDNGYRDYGTADLVRLLRIKRLASLGFPLERIGGMLDELDQSTGTSSATRQLDELDKALQEEIERLEAQRRTIALIKREQLSLDVPVQFSQAIRMYAGEEADLASLTDEERTFLLLAGNLYEDDGLHELERVTAAIQEQGLMDQAMDLDRRVGRLPQDAGEAERAQLTAEMLELLEPLLDVFNSENWNRPYTPGELAVLNFQRTMYNDAQNDVLERIHQKLEDRLAQRQAAREGAAHTSSTSSCASLDPDATS